MPENHPKPAPRIEQINLVRIMLLLSQPQLIGLTDLGFGTNDAKARVVVYQSTGLLGPRQLGRGLLVLNKGERYHTRG